jgi:exopolysaccharide production protein ExoQ
VPPQIATVLFAAGVAGLFWLDRDKSVRTSKGLWLPIIWFAIGGSRSVSDWLGIGPPKEVPGQLPATSFLDQLVAATLMLLGLMVLIRRRGDVASVLKRSWPIVVYFCFCLVSLLWSDFPGWGSKRWVRALGDLIMVLIVATEARPSAAFRRLFSRLGFVLLPASVLLIRYYPQLGQGWDEYGLRMYTGVTTNKNSMGDIAFLIGLGALWQILSLVCEREQPNRTRRLLAQSSLLAFAIDLSFTAQCSTAGACFTLGAGLMLVFTLPFIRCHPAAVHTLVFAMLLGGLLMSLLGGWDAMTKAVGRKPDLTGRTEIWAVVIPMVPNRIVGAGFETFWVGPRVEEISRRIGGLQMTNEAHNGYIEAYLNLGYVGVSLIVLILAQGYFTAVDAFRRDPAVGGLLVAYVVTAVPYNVTEAGFRMLSLEWFSLLLSVVVASRLISLGETASASGRELADPESSAWATQTSSHSPSAWEELKQSVWGRL